MPVYLGDKILRTPINPLNPVPDIRSWVRCWRFGSVQPKPRSTRTSRFLIFSGIIHSCLRTFKLNQFERRLINSNDGWVQTIKYLKYIQHKNKKVWLAGIHRRISNKQCLINAKSFTSVVQHS